MPATYTPTGISGTFATYQRASGNFGRATPTPLAESLRTISVGIGVVRFWVSMASRPSSRPTIFFKNFSIQNISSIIHLVLLAARIRLPDSMSSSSSDHHRLALVRGRGGIGKTKLLHAFSEGFRQRHPGFVLRFVPDGVPITRESADELASSPLVIVLDDAHRRDREELGLLFAIAQQRKQALKLILSLRPNGYDAVHSRLVQSGFDLGEITPVIDLNELDRRGVKELASQVLGKSHAHFVDRLAAASWDCPLVTVIGGRLLLEKAVAPELLERQVDFQQVVLSKFADEIVGKVSDRIEPDLCRSLLKLVAAVMPFDPLDEGFVKSTAEFLNKDRMSLVRGDRPS